MGKKAIILLSGGLDSTVMLAKAIHQGMECVALSFDYNQRHKIELMAAQEVAAHYKIQHRIVMIDPTYFSNSALVGKEQPHQNRTLSQIGSFEIPNTYVPARNTLFLVYAAGLAEMVEANEIHFGANKLDRAPYPDCRPAYLSAFQHMLRYATKQAVQGQCPELVTPFLDMDKSEIILEGLQVGAPLHLTFSCYNPVNNAQCGHCDACILRKDGFAKAERRRINAPSFSLRASI